MPRYLIDVNLPRYFSVWNTDDYVHQADIDMRKADEDIWLAARENGYIIISKDSDFSNRISFHRLLRRSFTFASAM